ncbi:MAG: ATP-binding protein, partial [Candidatus Dadabacteria bacterium]|nr:ATP-binding protein [Candidatus Dadabacteria bacterium]
MGDKFKDLFQRLFRCNGEEELHQIVTSEQLLKTPENWYPYGGRNKDDRSNFGTFENQQSHAGAALVEKITNSIDALLLKECKLRGIDPKSDDAPKTMEKATEEFFNISNGDIGGLLSGERTKLAKENIQIVATGGDNHTPDLLIYDNGEGQHPNDFKTTFLSIANNNKTDIPFVQGKYNMGSTGAVVFCGKHRYQIIGSKKNQEIFDRERNYNNNLFGWTLVRRHP